MTFPKEQEIISAWYSVKDRWFVRRNKLNPDASPFEVVHDCGNGLISDETMQVIGAFSGESEAMEFAKQRENLERATAVRKLMSAKGES